MSWYGTIKGRVGQFVQQSVVSIPPPILAAATMALIQGAWERPVFYRTDRYPSNQMAGWILTILVQNLPVPVEGVPYSFTPQVTGGTPPYNNFSFVAGNPGWMTISTTTGQLGGTPPIGSGGQAIVGLTIQCQDSA